jgi:hypothetical protein
MNCGRGEVERTGKYVARGCRTAWQTAFMAAHPLRRPEWMRMARAGEMACWAAPSARHHLKNRSKSRAIKMPAALSALGPHAMDRGANSEALHPS